MLFRSTAVFGLIVLLKVYAAKIADLLPQAEVNIGALGGSSWAGN